MREYKVENERPDDQYQGVGSFILEIVKIVVLAFIIIVPIRVFLFLPFFVQGASMEPNFENNEYIIVNEFGYKKTSLDLGGGEWFTVNPFKEIKRQTVVVFKYPRNPSQFFIKRVIGLPGEKVEIKNNQTIIYNEDNPEGFTLDEREYLGGMVRTGGDLVINLKEDEYFVMGDNRPASSDSRAWGPIRSSDIIGEVLLRAWPLNRVTTF